MTDTQAAPTPEDIADDSAPTRLDREPEDRAFAPRPLREAVREDAAMARDWGRERASRLRGAVETRPVRATLYALGLGVVIGLLIAR